jgi:guanosine-3',5'-bis(diphosphate) 3'-pyrophosphohydrolase
MKHALWQRAAAFASCGHKYECRDDDDTPYFSHPARVALTVALFGCTDPAALAAASLHNVMENTDEGYDDLHERFGPEVADMVVALTKNMMLPRAAREKDYLKRLARADWRARLIKLADQYDNVSDALRGKKKGLRQERTKAKEILRLSARDARKHPPVAQAGRALKALLAR